MLAPPGWMVLPAALVIGSFLGVVVRRLPAGRALALARSQCESCGHVLSPRELVPLFSFVLQRGRCLHCEVRIGWFHPAIELASLAVALAAFTLAPGGWVLWADAALGWALLTAAWIDIERYRLPDVITLPLLLAGLVVTWMRAPWMIYDHALAAALGYAVFRLLDTLYWRLRGRHGLGQGDAKLLAAAGAWTGLAAVPTIVLAAGLLGLGMALPLAARRGQGGQTMIPFGPALALACFGMVLLGS
ncbi:MAG TPA: A24 family peptidase [Acidocella sp.]|uniref:prepilin peptidase n=1 Tax=Acidocella sp. TaxID=50710 RepID=UPI002C6E3D52|nr:A24 family peptidase [Acidocella sp.]HVE20524.1 A24 family peptidase [Acidocella sp.]